MADLQEIMREEQAEIVVLPESHLWESYEDEEVAAPGYVILRIDREWKRPEKQQGEGEGNEVGSEEDLYDDLHSSRKDYCKTHRVCWQ